jgi:putative DNA primase/helicase
MKSNQLDHSAAERPPNTNGAMLDGIPIDLRDQPQWVLWKIVVRDGEPTKIPFQVDGAPAKSNDPSTWTGFDSAWNRYQQGGYDGVGFMFSKDGGFAWH